MLLCVDPQTQYLCEHWRNAAEVTYVPHYMALKPPRRDRGYKGRPLQVDTGHKEESSRGGSWYKEGPSWRTRAQVLWHTGRDRNNEIASGNQTVQTQNAASRSQSQRWVQILWQNKNWCRCDAAT
jgi:hypothetical protein